MAMTFPDRYRDPSPVLSPVPSGHICRGSDRDIPLGWEVVRLDGVIPYVDLDLTIMCEYWMNGDEPMVPSFIVSNQEPYDLIDGMEDDVGEDEWEVLEEMLPFDVWSSLVDELQFAIQEVRRELGLQPADPQEIEDPDVPIFCDFCKRPVDGEPMIRAVYGTMEPLPPDGRTPSSDMGGHFDEEESMELMCLSCMALMAEQVMDLWTQK